MKSFKIYINADIIHRAPYTHHSDSPVVDISEPFENNLQT